MRWLDRMRWLSNKAYSRFIGRRWVRLLFLNIIDGSPTFRYLPRKNVEELMLLRRKSCVCKRDVCFPSGLSIEYRPKNLFDLHGSACRLNL